MKQKSRASSLSSIHKNSTAWISTVALLISYQQGKSVLLDFLSDDYEIRLAELALQTGQLKPFIEIYKQREKRTHFEGEISDQNSTSREVKIESFQKQGRESAKVIAEYAYQIFQQDHSRTDFTLSNDHTQVRIRVFQMPVGGTYPA